MYIQNVQIHNEVEKVIFVEQKINLPIYMFDLTQCVDNSKIIETAKLYIQTHESAGHGTLSGDGYQSPYIPIGQTNLFPDLFDEIKCRLDKIQQIAYKKTPESEHHYYENKCIAFWIVMLTKDSEMKFHNHVFPKLPDYRRWSTVYYAKSNDDAAPIVFMNGETEVKIKPKQGRLLVFSSLLFHKVESNDSNEERISIVSNW